MKKLALFFAIPVLLFSLFAISCSMQKPGAEMQVIRDCTGTYLRMNKKDYHVCNVEKLAAFADGQTIRASFKKISECSKQPEIVCMMFHENEGWVEVKKVK